MQYLAHVCRKAACHMTRCHFRNENAGEGYRIVERSRFLWFEVLESVDKKVPFIL